MEKLHPQEKIVLACNQINVMTMQLSHLMIQLSTLEVTRDSAQDIYNELEETSVKCIDVMNGLADYMNGRDAVTEIDNHLFDNIFEELNKE